MTPNTAFNDSRSARRRAIPCVTMLFTLLVLGAGSFPLLAQTTTWTGAVSADWNDGGNWDSSAPTASVGAVVPSGTPNDPSVSGTSAACSDLTLSLGATLEIQPGSTLSLSGGASAAGTITGDGLIRLIGAGPVDGNLGNVEVDTAGTILAAGSGMACGTLTLLSGELKLSSDISVVGVAQFLGGTLTDDGLGSGQLFLNGDVTFSGTSVSPDLASIYLYGTNWTSDASFAPGGGHVIFSGGAQTISASGSVFRDVTVEVTSTVDVAAGPLALDGSLDVIGTFSGSSTVRFVGDGSISGLLLPNVEIDTAGAILAGDSAGFRTLKLLSGELQLSSDISVVGVAQFLGGTLTHAGAGLGQLFLNGDVTFSGTSVSPDIDYIYTYGTNWTSDASFTPGGGRVIFNGGPQTVSASGSVFHDVTVGSTSTVDVVVGPLVLDTSLDVVGTFTASSTVRCVGDGSIDGVLLPNVEIDTAGAILAGDGAGFRTLKLLSGELQLSSDISVVGAAQFLGGTLTHVGLGLGQLFFNGDVTFSGTSVSPDVDYIYTYGANWTSDASFAPGGVHVIFNGGPQTVSASGSVFSDVTVGSTSTVDVVVGPLVLTSSLDVVGTFTVSSTVRFVGDGSIDGLNLPNVEIDAAGAIVAGEGGQYETLTLLSGELRLPSYINVFGEAQFLGGTLSDSGSGLGQLSLHGDATFTGTSVSPDLLMISHSGASWTSDATFAPGGGQVLLDGSETKTVSASGSVFPDVIVNTTVELVDGSTGQGAVIEATSLNVASAGSVRVDGLGFPGGIDDQIGGGPGGGLRALTGCVAGNTGGGAGHGGAGGTSGGTGIGGPVYGSPSAPLQTGSGGAGGGCGGEVGGAGGGAIKLIVTGSLTVDGTLSADGGSAAATPRSGGGSGGSIWVLAGSLAGTGTILASGGDGDTTATPGGAGGGGRLVLFANGSTFSGTAQTLGGGGSVPGAAGQVVHIVGVDSLVTQDAPADEALVPTTAPTFQWSGLTLMGSQQFVLEIDDDPLFGESSETGSPAQIFPGVTSPFTVPPLPTPGTYYWHVYVDNLGAVEGGSDVHSLVSSPCTNDGDCNDANDCTVDSCDVGTGMCSNPTELDGTACGDAGTDCVNADSCFGGVCQDNGFAPPGMACGDAGDTDCSNPDSCDGGGTCLPQDEIDGTPCEEGDLCTESDTCLSGMCASGAPPDCNDANLCTSDSCNPGTGCIYTPEPDFDGDGSCDALDCDPFNPDVYPWAPEVNDGIDNQCPGDPGFGSIDEISGVAGLFNPADADEFSWAPQLGATMYEVARSTSANFSTDCVVLGPTVDSFLIDPATPLFNQVLHYLVRALPSGSWGQDSAGTERTACSTVLSAHTILATSGTWAGDSFGGDQALQDYLCQQAGTAGAATAPLGRSWLALTSDSIASLDARDRILWSGPVVNTAGEFVEPTPLAWPWSPLDNAVRYDENGADLGAVKAHTGTNDDGTASGADCQGGGRAWDGSDSLLTTGRVNSTMGVNGWMNGGGIDSCSSSYHLYCASVREETDHYIFATSVTVQGLNIGGLTQADKLCQTMADTGTETAVLGRQWVALMSDSIRGIDARDRLTWHGPVRNVAAELVEPTPETWPWSPLDNAVRYDENGVDVGSSKSHTGTNDDGTASGADCQGGGRAWDGIDTLVTAGRVNSTAGVNGWMNGGGVDSCSSFFHLYCVSR